MSTNRMSTLCSLALAGALYVSLPALAAEASPAPTSASGATTKKVTKKVADAKADGGRSAPGCDESNGPGKKGPSLPKCPEAGKIGTQSAK